MTPISYKHGLHGGIVKVDFPLKFKISKCCIARRTWPTYLCS